MTQQKQPLLLETAFLKSLSWAKKNRIPLLSAMISGFLAYGFVFTNKLVNHDEVRCLFTKGATIDSGRFGLGLMDTIFPNVSMPWIYGIVTLVLIAISACVIVQIFSIRTPAIQALVASTVTVFPSLIGLYGYMFTTTSYAVSFFLAVLAVQMAKKPGWIWAGISFCCIVLSVSIYQSYIAIIASLLVVVLIQELLIGKDALSVFKKGVFYVLLLAVSLGAYYVAAQIVMALKGLSFGPYASANLSFSFSALPSRILVAYRRFFSSVLELDWGLIPTAFSRKVHYVLFLSVAVFLLIWLCQQRRQDLARALLLLALVLLMPLAINCMYLFATEDAVHTLVLYAFVAVYVLAGVFADYTLSNGPSEKVTAFLCRFGANLASLALALILICNIYVANASFLNLYLRYENAYSFYTSLVTQIKQLPDFTPETKLAIIGTWDSPDFYETEFEYTLLIEGARGFQPDTYSKDYFLQYYLGISIPFATEEEISEITATDAYKAMAVYPYSGSMEKFGDIVVVKLS